MIAMLCNKNNTNKYICLNKVIKIMELNNYILRKAIALGLCKEWKEKLSDINDVDKLLDFYLEGLDFCLNNNFPSNKDLTTLGGHKINDKGIYVDYKGDMQCKDIIVLLGESNVNISVNDYSVSSIYLKNKSIINLECSDNSFIMIDCFDNSIVNINSNDNSKIVVNAYGNAKVNFKENGNFKVKVVNKLKNKY